MDKMVEQVRKALDCRASQITNPGYRNCKDCPYCEWDNSGDCDDLRIMADALVVVDSLIKKGE